MRAVLPLLLLLSCNVLAAPTASPGGGDPSFEDPLPAEPASDGVRAEALGSNDPGSNDSLSDASIFDSDAPSSGDSLSDDSLSDGSQLWPVLGAAASSAAITGLVLGFGTRAWWDEGYESFTFRDTGWFGAETYAGGGDKAGHAVASYISLHVVASLYELFGIKPLTATWISAGFTFFLFNGFEFVDGFTHFGFEYGDAVANTVGIALGVATRLIPSLGRTVGLRYDYFPSRDFLAHEKSMLKFINDYTGGLFLFDIRGRGLLEAMGREPGLWRYLVGGVAFGAQGYSPIKRDEAERKRMLGLHLGLSVPELIRRWAPEHAVSSGVARFFEYFAVPGLSLMLLNDLNGSGWYFSLGVGERAQWGG